ncbi:sensor histidine kinase [Butyricimonas synergistica]|uniref:sensor histidine kinase n=1 Tax=Butyricimonas synergistica TaxID=544644 RepID=UPI0003820B30|nr:HAMP domain-containing sensor histidine kinase [Butyricimonas synergistica]
MYKDLKVVWIFVVIVGIILIVSQCWQLHSLFQKAKENYIYKYKSVVEDAVVELSMLTHKDGYLVGYDAEAKKISYLFDGKREDHYVTNDVAMQWMSSRPLYDVRDTSLWTLERVNKGIQGRVAERLGKDSLILELSVRDSSEYEVKRLRYGEFKGISSCRFFVNLGFLEKDTLEVTCDFTWDDFWEEMRDRVMFVMTLFLLLLFCIIFLVRRFWREKKTTAFRELFVQAFVHDLKLPVANALKCNYLLEKGLVAGDLEKNRLRLGLLANQLERIEGTIGMLLTTMVSEHGVSIHPGMMNVHELLKELAESGRWQVPPGRTFQIRVDFEDGPAFIEGDRMLLETVFQNLIENALKYSDGHVEVVLHGKGLEKGILVSVEDNGRGIPANALKRVFKTRYRLPRDRAQVRGTGIGLSVAKSVIEAHGGKIWAESEEGRGSRFMIMLPYQIATGWRMKLKYYTRKMIRILWS